MLVRRQLVDGKSVEVATSFVEALITIRDVMRQKMNRSIEMRSCNGMDNN